MFSKKNFSNLIFDIEEEQVIVRTPVSFENWIQTAYPNTYTSITQLSNEDYEYFQTIAPTSIRHWFSGANNLMTVDLLHLDVSNVTLTGNCFKNCTSLVSLDLHSWNTSNFVNCGSFFTGCTNLKFLDLSGWDLGNCTNFGGAFTNCTNLKYIILNNSNVFTVMPSGAIGNLNSTCKILVPDNLLNTYKAATNWSTIADRIESVDNYTIIRDGLGNVSVFAKENNTSDFSYWAENTYPLTYETFTSIPSEGLSILNNASPTDMKYAFFDCAALTSVDGSGWDFSSCTNMSYMFYNCHALTTANFTGINTSNCTTFRGMFHTCSNLTSIDCSNWDVSKGTEFVYTFGNCYNITVIDLSGWNPISATNMGGLFANDNNLEYLILNSNVAMKMVSGTIGNLPITTKILVPGSMISTYQSMTNWKKIPNQFYDIANYTITKSNGTVMVTPNS